MARYSQPCYPAWNKCAELCIAAAMRMDRLLRFVAVFQAVRNPDDPSGSWVRFEGPGKLHVRRWHRVTQSTANRPVTLCGRYVWVDQVRPVRGEGIECATCARLFAARRSESS